MTPTPGVTTPPTDEQVQTAYELLRDDFPESVFYDDLHMSERGRVQRLAQALADQAAAIHARYEKDDLELRSQVYAWLGDRTSQPDGDVWKHEQLMPAARDLVALIRRVEADRA